MFSEDLNIGLNQERIFLDKIREKYPSATQINAYKGYDIWIPEISTALEIKYDPMSIETGNYVIEIEFNNKPSALFTTKADYWIIYDNIEYLMITPNNIIRCIMINKLIYKEFIGNGDNRMKKAYLIRKELLKKYGKIIF